MNEEGQAGLTADRKEEGLESVAVVGPEGGPAVVSVADQRRGPKFQPVGKREKDEIVRRYKAGEAVRKIAKFYGLTDKVVRRILCQRRVKVRPRGAPELPEEEWEMRRRIARECATVREYTRRLGMRQRDYLSKSEKAHGLVIGGKET